jgi:hypothetical protein
MFKDNLILMILIFKAYLEGVHHVVIKSAAGCGLKKYQEYKTFLE